MTRAPVLLALALLAAGCGRLSFGSGTTDATPADTSPDSIATDPDVLGYWPLDEGANATAFADLSAYANHGECQYCPTTGVPGVRGNAIEIGATPAGIRIPPNINPALMMLTGPFTISAWVRLAAINLYGVIVSSDRDCCGGTTLDGFSLWGTHYSAGPALVTWTQGNQGFARGAMALPLGVWSHVVGTFDGTYNRVYVNGVRVSLQPSAGYRAPFDYDIWIGALGYGAPDYHIAGSIDEVLIIGRALQDTDVTALYASYPPQ